MPTEIHPMYLDSIILIAVRFGRDNCCKLDHHLVCQTDKDGMHVEFTAEEVISTVTIEVMKSIERNSWSPTSTKREERSLQSVEEEEASDGEAFWQKDIMMSGESQDATEPTILNASETGSQLGDWDDEGSYLLPPHLPARAATPLSLATSFTGYSSTFSGEPGPGYIVGKALYWTGSRMIAAFERLNINNRVRSHIEFLQKKRMPNRPVSSNYGLLFQILDDALELSKPSYPNFVNKYSIRLYNEYVKFLKRRFFPRSFFQTISSAMLTLSVITWLTYQNYEQELRFKFIKELVKICTYRPVRLHDSDEMTAIRIVISPHLSWIIPYFPDIDENTLRGFWSKHVPKIAVLRKSFEVSWVHLESGSDKDAARLCSFISSFPWLVVAAYEADHELSGKNSKTNVLEDFESLFFARMDSDSGWAAFMARIEAYCSLICTGIEIGESQILQLDEIVRNTFYLLYRTLDSEFDDIVDKWAWRAFKKDSMRNTAMEILVELLIWMRCELVGLHGHLLVHSEPSQEFLLKLWESGLLNLSHSAASHLSRCHSLRPLMMKTIVE